MPTTEIKLPNGKVLEIEGSLTAQQIQATVAAWQETQGRAQPLTGERRPSDAAPAGGTFTAEMQQKEALAQAGDELATWAPVALMAAPGFRAVGPVIRTGITATAFGLGSVTRDELMNTLGIEHYTPGEILKRGALTGTLGALSEGVPALIGRGFSLAKKPVLGVRPSAAERAVYEEATKIGPVSVAQYRPGALASVADWFKGSALGTASSFERGNQFLAGLEREIPGLLDRIATRPGVYEPGTGVGKALAETHRTYHIYASDKLYKPAFGAIRSAGAGEMVVPRPQAADLGSIAQAVERLAEANVDLVPEATTIRNLFNKMMRIGPEEAEALSGKNVEGKSFDEIAALNPKYAEALRRGAKTAGFPEPKTELIAEIEDVHDARSSLLRLARKTERSNPRLSKMARDSASFFRDAMEENVTSVQGGQKLWQNLLTADKYYRVGAEFFDNASIVEMASKHPEKLIASLRDLSDYGALKEVKRALVVYGQDRPKWNMLKRLMIQDQLHTAALEVAGESSKPALDLFTGIPRVAQKLRQNPDALRYLVGDDPETAAAINRLMRLSEVIERNGPLIGRSSTAKIGTYWLLHLAYGAAVGVPTGLVSGSWEKGIAGGAITAGTGIALTGLIPGAITKLMYSKAGGNLFIRGMDNALSNLAKGRTVNAHDLSNIVRAFVVARADRNSTIQIDPTKVEVDPEALKKNLSEGRAP